MSIEAGTKFLGLSSEVDTTERRSAQINKKSEHYTIEDLTSHISTEVQNSIEIPEVTQVTANDIVSELSVENYDTIRSNVKGYKSTIISITSFDLSGDSVYTIPYTEHGFTIDFFPSFISWNPSFFGWTCVLNNVGDLSTMFARPTVLTSSAPSLSVYAELYPSSLPDDEYTLYVTVANYDGTAIDNTSALNINLELEFRTY